MALLKTKPVPKTRINKIDRYKDSFLAEFKSSAYYNLLTRESFDSNYIGRVNSLIRMWETTTDCDIEEMLCEIAGLRKAYKEHSKLKYQII